MGSSGSLRRSVVAPSRSVDLSPLARSLPRPYSPLSSLRPEKSRLLESLRCDFVRYNITIEIMTDKRAVVPRVDRSLLPPAPCPPSPPLRHRREEIARPAASLREESRRSPRSPPPAIASQERSLVFPCSSSALRKFVSRPEITLAPPPPSPRREGTFTGAGDRSFARLPIQFAGERAAGRTARRRMRLHLTCYDYYQLGSPCITAACYFYSPSTMTERPSPPL